MPSYQAGETICDDLELEIFATTGEYQRLLDEYDRLLTELELSGWGFDENGEWKWSEVRWLEHLATMTLQLDWLSYQVATTRITLDILAATYEVAGCWGQAQNGGASTGGTDPGGSETVCEEEWIVLEVSYDDGATWEFFWAGYATVCYAT